MDKKAIKGWVFYDWANSVYSLVISTTIFPIYYSSVTESIKEINILSFKITPSELYTYSLTISFLLVVLIAPILSGIADSKGIKKTFMKFFCYLGGFSCMTLTFFNENTLWLGIAFSILANIGFWGSMVFYNGFLPQIAPLEQHDSISAKAYSMGYIGSSILLIINLIMISNYEWFGFVNKILATQVSFLIVGFWWISFAQITFVRIKEEKKQNTKRGSILKGYSELKKTFKQVRQNNKLKKYLYSYFFFNTGVQTIILLASLFGSNELGLDSSTLILTILITQFVGVIGASLFSKLSNRYGNIKGLQMAILVWIFICIASFLIDKNSPSVQIHFFVIATFVGLVMGGIQSLSRSTYSKLIPKDTEDYATYFSFYDVTEKISIVIGTFTYGLVLSLTGSMKISALVLGIFFIIGFVLSLYIPKSNHS